jgi:hypothetical protein
VYAAFDSTKRLSERIRDLMVFISFKIQHERLFEDLGQAMYGRMDILHPEVAFRTVVDCGLIVIQEEIIRRIVEYGILLGLTTVVIDENVPHDGVQPGFDIGADTVLLMIGQCPEHRFLQKIFRSLLIFRERHRKGLEELRILQQQLVELFGRHGRYCLSFDFSNLNIKGRETAHFV